MFPRRQGLPDRHAVPVAIQYTLDGGWPVGVDLPVLTADEGERAVQEFGGVRTFRGILRHRGDHQRFEAGGKAVEVGVLVQDATGQLLGVAVAERVVRGRRERDQRAPEEDVGAAGDGVAAILFRADPPGVPRRSRGASDSPSGSARAGEEGMRIARSRRRSRRTRIQRVASSAVAWCAMPKSRIFGPVGAMMTLLGLRSRCTIPASWIPWRASAAPTARADSIPPRNGPCRSTWRRTVGPGTYSVTSHGISASTSARMNRATHGLLTRASSRASCAKRLRNRGSAAWPGWIILIARYPLPVLLAAA